MPERRVLVTGAELAPAAMRILEEIGARVDLMAGKVTAEALGEQLRVKTHAILMRGNPPIGAELMSLAPDLKVIAKHGAGVDSVDLAAATARGVLVMTANDANAPAVAEHTIALILALARDVVTLADRTRGGEWARGSYAGQEVTGRTLGLVGFGRIGRRVAVIARALGIEVVALSAHPGGVDAALAREVATVAELLAVSDIVSLHAPLNAATRGMINRESIALMKHGALLINTARGAMVDEAALLDALHSGRIGGAALDTLTEEPPPSDYPLLRAPNLIVTPHIAAMTAGAIVRMGVSAATNIAAVLTHAPLDRDAVVNKDLLDPR